jgi:hypothetical protein
MTQADFIPMRESQLALSGVPFERAELLAWVAFMWPYIADDPDSVRWAVEFVEARRVPC